MNFNVERNLENQIFTTKIKFESFGGVGITPEEEQELVADVGYPTIDVGSSEYIGKYKYDLDTNSITEDETGDEIKFILNSLKVEVKEGFEVSFTRNAKKELAEELNGKTSLTKLSHLSEAKCLLFEKVIKAKLESAINGLRSNISQFEKNTPETFTV